MKNYIIIEYNYIIIIVLLIKNYCKNDRNFSSTLPMTFRLNKTE